MNESRLYKLDLSLEVNKPRGRSKRRKWTFELVSCDLNEREFQKDWEEQDSSLEV